MHKPNMDIDHEAIGSQQLSSTEDIYRAMRALQLYRSLIMVTVGNSAKIGSSLVLDVRLETQTIYIDEPSDFTQTPLDLGDEILIRAAYGGIQVSGTFTITNLLELETGLAIELKFPKKLLHRQRRAAFRVTLATPGPETKLESYRRETAINGIMVDISADGVSIEFDKFVKPPIQPGELFQPVSFTYEALDWSVALIAKHPSYDKQTDKYRCGFSFHQLTKAQSKTLNQWILKLQRNQQKRAAAAPKSPLIDFH